MSTVVARSRLGFPRDPALSVPRQPVALGLLLITGALVWPVTAHALTVWTIDQEFSYGFLVPPVSLFLCWWRRGALRSCIPRGSDGGIALVLGAAAIYVFGVRVGIYAISGLALSPLLLGMIAYLWGWPSARVVAFPVAFLAFGFGLYRGLLDSAGFALQNITATGAEVLANAIGLAVSRDGLIIHVGSSAFLIAEQCSGLSSLLSLLALATVWAYVIRGRVAVRVGLLPAVLPMVVVANTLRVTAVLVVARWLGPDTATGFFHGYSSLVLFGLALAGLVLMSRVFGCKLPSLSQ